MYSLRRILRLCWCGFTQSSSFPDTQIETVSVHVPSNTCRLRSDTPYPKEPYSQDMKMDMSDIPEEITYVDR
jgi:hypothetical protein